MPTFTGAVHSHLRAIELRTLTPEGVAHICNQASDTIVAANHSLMKTLVDETQYFQSIQSSRAARTLCPNSRTVKGMGKK